MRGELLVPILIAWFYLLPSFLVYRRIRRRPDGSRVLRSRMYLYWMTGFTVVSVTTVIMLPSIAVSEMPLDALVILSVLLIVATGVAGYGTTRLLSLTFDR